MAHCEEETHQSLYIRSRTEKPSSDCKRSMNGRNDGDAPEPKRQKQELVASRNSTIDNAAFSGNNGKNQAPHGTCGLGSYRSAVEGRRTQPSSSTALALVTGEGVPIKNKRGASDAAKGSVEVPPAPPSIELKNHPHVTPGGTIAGGNKNGAGTGISTPGDYYNTQGTENETALPAQGDEANGVAFNVANDPNNVAPKQEDGNELQEPNQGAIDAVALANDNVNDEPQENEAGNMDPEEVQEPNQFVNTVLLQSLPQALRNAVIALPPQVTPATTPTEFARIVLQMHIANDRFPLPDFQAGDSPANRFAQPGEEVPVPEANIRPKDFLCGRMTVNTHDHDGNRYRKHLIDLFLVLYCIYDARHAMKSRLSRWIVTEATTGRFLEKVGEGMFRLMTFEQAWKTGVGQQFRDELRRRKKNDPTESEGVVENADEASIGTFLPEDDWLDEGVPIFSQEGLDVLFSIERTLPPPPPPLAEPLDVSPSVTQPPTQIFLDRSPLQEASERVGQSLREN